MLKGSAEIWQTMFPLTRKVLKVQHFCVFCDYWFSVPDSNQAPTRFVKQIMCLFAYHAADEDASQYFEYTKILYHRVAISIWHSDFV